MKTLLDMMRLFAMFFLAWMGTSGCGKDEVASCELSMCDEGRKTVMTATNWRGTMGYYNDLRKWAVNVPIPNTIDGLRTCILCNDIPDSLKTIGLSVEFSGALKENCNEVRPALGGQVIYFVMGENLKK